MISGPCTAMLNYEKHRLILDHRHFLRCENACQETTVVRLLGLERNVYYELLDSDEIVSSGRRQAQLVKQIAV